MAEQNEGIEVSVEELRAKYAQEQLKRLRTDGLKQFSGLKEQFEELDQDPYADPNFTRDAIVEETEVVIVGGGFRRHAHGRRLAEPRDHQFPHRGKGRRLRRHLVLEPLPRLHVRC